MDETTGLTIGEAIRLVQDPYEGKYPSDTAHRREVLQSLRFAERAWRSTPTWTAIKKRDLRALGRRRIDELVKEGKRGARTAEKVLEHVLAVASWLRDNERIPETACLPSSKWTDELYETGERGPVAIRTTRSTSPGILATRPWRS